MGEQIALGMIETKGLIGLIEASDAAIKAAQVIAVDYERSGGGLTIVKLRGTVGAVKAAVEAGTLAAQKVGQLVSSHVIPNPGNAIENLITPKEKPTTREPAKEFHNWKKTKSRRKEMRAAAGKPMTVKITGEDKRLVLIAGKIEKKGVDSLDYNELRYLARRIDEFPISKTDIRNAGKAQILSIIKNAALKIIK